MYLKIGNGMVETHVKKRKHDDNCRLVLKENHAVMSSVIIIPHASVHRPRRWLALRLVRCVLSLLLKRNSDEKCSCWRHTRRRFQVTTGSPPFVGSLPYAGPEMCLLTYIMGRMLHEMFRKVRFLYTYKSIFIFSCD